MKDEFARGMRNLTPEESKELKKYYESLCDKVDFAPVIHAKWADIKVADGEPPVVSCSICGMCFCDIINNHHYMYHYCPNCGAKMDKE